MATRISPSLTRRSQRLAIFTGVLLLIGGGIAFAYWTNSGSGTGSAATGDSDTITVNQTSVVTAMGPGVAAQPISGDFDNPNDGPVYVTSVTVALGAITGGGPTCEATDYTLTNAVSDVNAQVPAGTGVGSWGGTDTPTIAFNNKAGENQDDCKNATVALVLTSN
jgi:hypothetical protein